MIFRRNYADSARQRSRAYKTVKKDDFILGDYPWAKEDDTSKQTTDNDCFNIVDSVCGGPPDKDDA